MSASARQKIAVVVAATLAVGLLGFVTLRDRSTETTPAAPLGTVTTVPSKPVDVVDLSTPAQAAIAVSSRLFARSDLAVLTDSSAAAKKDAIATATRLKVPILLDDPAAPAELTRLRATRILTFGTVSNVVGAEPAASTDLKAEKPSTSPQPTRAVVLMKSNSTFDVAAAAVTIAGATVLTSKQSDLRRDTTAAAALAQRPDAAVIALGAPFSSSPAYTLRAAQQKATQIGGGYLALTGRRFVGLHGVIDDPTSGVLGRQDLAASLARVAKVADKFAANDSRTIVPMLEVVADEMKPAELTAVVDAAEKAGVYVLLDLRAGSATFLAQAMDHEKLLSRKNVGLTLETGTKAPATPVADVNRTSDWLADLTGAQGLPQKLFVVREALPLVDRSSIDTSRPELAVVLVADQAGSQSTKQTEWAKVRAGAPKGAAFGWMQYLELDRPMLTVNQTYRQISPYPSVLIYQ